MKKVLFVLFLGLLSLKFASCNNGGGEDCSCEEPPNGPGGGGGGSYIASEGLQGDIHYCDERRATGSCVHTRKCAASKETDGFDWKAKKVKK